MSKPGKSWVYALLKPLVKAGSLLFFRKVKVLGLEHLPHNRPVILVANHQNAMLDPVISCLHIDKQLHWLTRSDVFKKGFVENLLRRFNMLPVYRERDNVKDLKGRNERTFEECYRRLQENAVICMFPEGTHRGKKQLFALKKGLARLAFGAIEHGVQRPVIVPVGLDYTDYYHPLGTLQLHVGKPIEVHDYSARYSDDSARTIVQLMEEVRMALSAQMIDVQTDHNYTALMQLEALVWSMYARLPEEKRFRKFQKLTHDWAAEDALPAEVRKLIHTYSHEASELLIDEWRVGQLKATAFSWWAILLHLPLAFMALPAWLLFSPFHAFTEFFIRNNVKDTLFNNSIRMVFWVFLSPIWWIMTSALLSIFLGPMVWVLLISACSGILALKWWPHFSKWRMLWRIHRLRKTAPERFEKWHSGREALVRRLRTMLD